MKNLWPGCCVFVLLAGTLFGGTDLSGKWSGIASGPIYVVIKQDGNKLSGTAGPTAAEQLVNFDNGTVDDDNVHLKIGPFQMELRVVGDELRGEANGEHVFLKRVDKIPADARFEVASIKRVAPDPNGTRSSMNLDPSRLVCTNVSLRKLIVNSYSVRDFQVIGPDWLNSQPYNIEATLPPGASGEQVLVMIRNLLADRFHLEFHRESRELPVYALLAGKNGPKLAEGTAGRGRTSSSPGKIVVENALMRNFVESLTRWVDLPVVDMTGLKSTYSFTLEWTPDHAPSEHEPGGPAVSEATAGPSIFTAIQEQLGLKLEPRKAPMEVLVIDRADKVPTEN
jgi:uncharacterized protein (TIGR03435 family)